MPRHNIRLSDFTLSQTFDAHRIEATTRKFGAAVLPSFVTGPALQALQDEFMSVVDDQNPDFVYKLTYPAGKGVSLKNNDAFSNAYPSIGRFFNQDVLLSFARQYVGTPCLPNQEIYATYEFEANSPVAPTHFDKLWNLKFMLYVGDVGTGNAPFGIVPGSATENRETFRRIFSDNNITTLQMRDSLYQNMANARPPELDDDVVEIVAPAGTLIVFDTDTSHRARPVEQGKVRKILRGHSGPYAKYETVKRYSRRWWRGQKAYSSFDVLKDNVLGRAS